MNQELFFHLVKAEKYFNNTQYSFHVSRARSLFEAGLDEACFKALSNLPTEKQLLTQLTEKLQGKSVYRTLQKIAENKCKNKSEYAKGIFSLGTHVLIECESGHLEYKILLPMIYERLGEVLTQLDNKRITNERTQSVGR